MADQVKRSWAAFKDIAIIFSFVVNLVLVLVLLIVAFSFGSINGKIITPLLGNLDGAFADLGEAHIQDTISISQPVPVNFTLPLRTETMVILTKPVPLQVPATFSLGQFGQINGTVSLQLPAGLALPVNLDLQVPVNEQIAVKFDQPIDIKLGDKGLGPVVKKLRGVLEPYIALVSNLPQ